MCEPWGVRPVAHMTQFSVTSFAEKRVSVQSLLLPNKDSVQSPLVLARGSV